MITAKLGKAVFTPKKNYQPGDVCEPLDVVAHMGSLWACLEATRETPLPESPAWMHLLDGGTARIINTDFPLKGGRSLADDVTLELEDAAEGDTLVFHNGRWTFRKPYELCEFYYFRHPTARSGFVSAQGGLITDASVKYPEAWDYLVSGDGASLCVTEAEWQAMTRATWATLADGTQVGWNGIGGAPFYAPNTATGDLRLPDLRGMYAEAAGFDSLGVGAVHGDGIREITGGATSSGIMGDLSSVTGAPLGGAFYARKHEAGPNFTTAGNDEGYFGLAFSASRVVPVAAKNQPRAWGALACVYLGQPAS